MLRYKMVVITRDNTLKRAVKRLTTATGAAAEFFADPSGLSNTPDCDLAILDARDKEPDNKFLKLVPESSKILYILRGDGMVNMITLLKDPRVTSLFCHDDRFDDDEFISSATKALRGEVFGLQKYFPWGVTTFTMVVKNYEQKGRAIDILLRYAQMAGVRGPVRDRIQLVCDELMMNALYHAPTDEDGNEKYADQGPKELAKLDEVSAIEVQYGCSGRYFGVSIRDGYGSLTRPRALEYLRRARDGSHIEDKKTGAGLGLVSVLRSVSKLIFNIDAGNSAEAIGLFDMELFAKGQVGARSLHLFEAAPNHQDQDEYFEEDNAAPLTSTRKAGWAVAAVLGAVVAALATAVYFKKVATAAPGNAPALTVQVKPESSNVQVNGKTFPSGKAINLPSSADPVKVEVSHDGYRTWTKSLDRSKFSSDTVFYIDLSKAN